MSSSIQNHPKSTGLTQYKQMQEKNIYINNFEFVYNTLKKVLKEGKKRTFFIYKENYWYFNKKNFIKKLYLSVKK